MAFLCDGSNHNTGIKNEVFLTNELNNGLMAFLYPEANKAGDVAIHIGGTGSKTDIGLFDKTHSNLTLETLKKKLKDGNIKMKKSISVKKKELEISGTFDWTNTTSYITANFNLLPHLKAVYDESRRLRSALTESQRASEKKSFERLIKDACNNTLIELQPETLKSLIQTEMINPNKDEMILVRCLDTGSIYHFPFSKHPMNAFVANPNNEFFLKKKRASAKGSQTIMVRDTTTNEEIDTGVRIRLHTNNGASAMLGISNSNKDSSFCIKFQQDNFNDIKSISTKHK
jgi:hypothetical protein